MEKNCLQGFFQLDEVYIVFFGYHLCFSPVFNCNPIHIFDTVFYKRTKL
jgi:hypothetical protein